MLPPIYPPLSPRTIQVQMLARYGKKYRCRVDTFLPCVKWTETRQSRSLPCVTQKIHGKVCEHGKFLKKNTAKKYTRQRPIKEHGKENTLGKVDNSTRHRCCHGSLCRVP